MRTRHIEPDMTLSRRERQEQREIADAERGAIDDLRKIEAELREQAIGERDDYLLSIANRVARALKHL